MASNIKITFIGTGGSWPSPGRGLPAVAVQIDEIINLFDCGEGSQKQLMKSNLSFMAIDNVFITHFHGDHFLGLLGMVQSMSFNNREKPLHIYGPKGAIRTLSSALNIGYYRPKFEIRVGELEADRTYDLGKFRISTMKNDHTVPAMSYRLEEPDMVRIDKEKAEVLGIPSKKLEELRTKGILALEGKTYTLDQVSAGIRKGRKIVYTGDTRPLDTMVEFARGVDVLIHETSTDSTLEPKVNEFGHTSARQAAEIAKKAGVEKFFLYHYSPRYESIDSLIKEALEIYPQSVASKELMEYDIPVRHESG
ncbi:MAG: ribonuclease Z [Candidatus Thermoplasmatota archaeon]|jgi:ribonuclease Z|nr:ribonuclease Z [Candidatus Thermoplasmatota archaeon]MCL5954616.1 ribonuclease Z [Candidatus Thermoplasmatota archaeon]